MPATTLCSTTGEFLSRNLRGLDAPKAGPSGAWNRCGKWSDGIREYWGGDQERRGHIGHELTFVATGIECANDRFGGGGGGRRRGGLEVAGGFCRGCADCRDAVSQ